MIKIEKALIAHLQAIADSEEIIIEVFKILTNTFQFQKPIHKENEEETSHSSKYFLLSERRGYLFLDEQAFVKATKDLSHLKSSFPQYESLLGFSGKVYLKN